MGRGFPGRIIARLTFGAGPSVGFTHHRPRRTGKVGPRFFMQVPDVFLPLAGSLSQCDWTATGIETHLRQRLPRTWKRIPVLMTQDLLASFPGQTAPDPARVAQSLRASPHAHRLLAHARKTGTLPAPWLHPPTFRPIPALAALPLPRLTTPEDLSDWLALPPDQLIRFTDPHGLSARNPTRFARHATAPPNARPSPA